MEEIKLGNSATSSLENMFETFRECTNLKSVDLSHFDFTHVTRMGALFWHDNNIENVNFGNSPTSSLTEMYQLFENCFKLK